MTIRKVLFRGVIVLAIIALLVVVYFTSKRPPPLAPLPNPNGYDDFVAAGKMVPASVGYWDDLDLDRLKATLATNQGALTLARRGLSRESQIWAIERNYPELNTNLLRMKMLAQAFVASGKLAEAEGRMDDAASDYASIIALAMESSRGGVLIHFLVEIAIERMGTARLGRVAPDLDARGSLQCLRLLEKADADRDSFAKIKVQEELFQLHAPLKEKIAELPDRILGRSQNAMLYVKSEKMYQASELSILKLESQLAAHAFELEKGRAATNWNDLVPAYLPSVPNDPTTNNLPIAFDSW